MLELFIRRSTNPAKVWLRLFSYCVMSVLAGSLLIAMHLAGASLAFGAGSEEANPQDSPLVTISGVISDSHCGARHATDAARNSADCARLCERRGAQYVIVDGDTIYLLSGSHTLLDAFAGRRIVVSGQLDGNTLRISSVRAQ